MPGPWSVTSTNASAVLDPTRTDTSPPPCSIAFATRFATIVSIRRRSLTTQTASPCRVTRSFHPRARIVASTSSSSSTCSSRTSSLPASKREIVMRSSTRRRSRATSATSSSAGRAASGGRRSSCSASIEASATSAVIGVRSSCATSDVNLRSRARASDSAQIFACSASAMRLNELAQAPNSSSVTTGGGERPTRDEPADDARHGNRGDPAKEQQRPERAKVAQDAVFREGEVQLGRRSGGTTTDDEVVAARDVQARERELSPLDEGADIFRNVRSDGWVRGEDALVVHEDGVDTASLETPNELFEIGARLEIRGELQAETGFPFGPFQRVAQASRLHDEVRRSGERSRQDPGDEDERHRQTPAKARRRRNGGRHRHRLSSR